jgi:hypothetical protein
MRRFILSLRYRWAMVNAYLSRDYAPIASAQWLTEADHCQMELWRMDRGMA